MRVCVVATSHCHQNTSLQPIRPRPHHSLLRRAADMSSLKGDDFFISGLAASHDSSQLKGNVVAVDATYYLRLLLERSHEPLIPAVGGPLALEDCIEVDLNKWKANDCTPFFVFDGCPVKGQDELSLELGRAANIGTNAAWELYNNAQAQPAVETFGLHSGKGANCSL